MVKEKTKNILTVLSVLWLPQSEFDKFSNEESFLGMSIATKNYLMLWNNACHLGMNTPSTTLSSELEPRKCKKNTSGLMATSCSSQVLFLFFVLLDISGTQNVDQTSI